MARKREYKHFLSNQEIEDELNNVLADSQHLYLLQQVFGFDTVKTHPDSFGPYYVFTLGDFLMSMYRPKKTNRNDIIPQYNKNIARYLNESIKQMFNRIAQQEKYSQKARLTCQNVLIDFDHNSEELLDLEHLTFSVTIRTNQPHSKVLTRLANHADLKLSLTTFGDNRYTIEDVEGWLLYTTLEQLVDYLLD